MQGLPTRVAIGTAVQAADIDIIPFAAKASVNIWLMG
jgi:hypothetical protein